MITTWDVPTSRNHSLPPRLAAVAEIGRRRNRADLRDQRTREHRAAAPAVLTLFDIAA